MHETIEHDNDEIGWYYCARICFLLPPFSNFDDGEIRFVLCALLQLYTNNPLKLSRTTACYFSCVHVAESEQDIQDTRQLSQTYSIYNKNWVDIVIAKYLARMAAHITNELHIYLATQAPRTEKHAATAADASHSESACLNKNLILTASHFCKPRVSICVCCTSIFRTFAP